MKSKKELIKQIKWINYFFLIAGICESALLIMLGIYIIPYISGPLTVFFTCLSLLTNIHFSRLLVGIWTLIKFNPVFFYFMSATTYHSTQPFAENPILNFLEWGLLISIGVISFILGIVIIRSSRKVMIYEKQDD